MKRSLYALLSFSLLALVSFSSAQSPLQWLNSLANSEEHLVHREQVGPYLVSADGQRLLSHPYLKFDIRHEGERLGADSSVRVDTVLYHADGRSRESYTARFDGTYFVIDPLELGDAATWDWDESGWLELSLIVDGPAGEGRGEVGFQVFPPKPEAGRAFGLINFGLPFLVLALFVAVYRARRVPLRSRAL